MPPNTAIYVVGSAFHVCPTAVVNYSLHFKLLISSLSLLDLFPLVFIKMMTKMNSIVYCTKQLYIQYLFCWSNSLQYHYSHFIDGKLKLSDNGTIAHVIQATVLDYSAFIMPLLTAPVFYIFWGWLVLHDSTSEQGIIDVKRVRFDCGKSRMCTKSWDLQKHSLELKGLIWP